MMGLLAVRVIDLAIFGTLGSLWIGGATFIVVLYRWIRRYEGLATPPSDNAVAPPSSVAPPKAQRHPGPIGHPSAASA